MDIVDAPVFWNAVAAAPFSMAIATICAPQPGIVVASGADLGLEISLEIVDLGNRPLSVIFGRSMLLYQISLL